MITVTDNARIDSALNINENQEEVLTRFKSIDINREKMSCLNDGIWLNDEVINMYTEILRARTALAGKVSCHFFNTFFYSKLSENGFNFRNVERWTKRAKVDIFSLDFVFIPINWGCIHWCLAVINIRDKCLEYYDSMAGSDHGCLKKIFAYLHHESLHKRRIPFDASEWKWYIPKDIPHQNNSFDCGMFVLCYMDSIANGHTFTFSQADFPRFRREVVLALLNVDDSQTVDLTEDSMTHHMRIDDDEFDHLPRSGGGYEPPLFRPSQQLYLRLQNDIDPVSLDCNSLLNPQPHGGPQGGKGCGDCTTTESSSAPSSTGTILGVPLIFLNPSHYTVCRVSGFSSMAVVEEQLEARLVTGTVREGVVPLFRPSQRRNLPPPQQSSNVLFSDLVLIEIQFRGDS